MGGGARCVGGRQRQGRAEGLSTRRGQTCAAGSAGTYRVRTRRIGFLPFISHPVVLPRRDELLLIVETPHVVLNTIVVNAKSGCKPSDSDSRSLAVVWDEIDKALRASQLTMQDLAGFGRGRLYRKELGYDGAVLSSDTTFFPITNRRPFGTRDPEALALRGYVLGEQVLGWDYVGPDETVLRSESFARTHCFRPSARAARPDKSASLSSRFHVAALRTSRACSG